MGPVVKELFQIWSASMDDVITVRHMLATDVELVFQWRNDPRVRQFMFNKAPLDSDAHAAWFDKTHQDPLRYLLLVCQGSRPFGFVQFTMKLCPMVADWGFYVDPKGPKGQGALLGYAALDYGFNALGLHRICGQVITHNQRSVIFHERLGFTAEGLLRSHHLTNNEYQDVHLFGLLASEWAHSTSASISNGHKV